MLLLRGWGQITHLDIIEVHLLYLLVVASDTLQYLLDVGGIWGLIWHWLVLVRLHHTWWVREEGNPNMSPTVSSPFILSSRMHYVCSLTASFHPLLPLLRLRDTCQEPWAPCSQTHSLLMPSVLQISPLQIAS